VSEDAYPDNTRPDPRIRPAPWTIFKQLVARASTIRVLVGAYQKASHRDKILGQLWSLLEPLLTMAVYFLVFGIGFRQAGEAPLEFVLYLFVGILVWRFFGETVTQATQCLRSHRGLILSASFPKAVIPAAVTASRFFDLLWGLLIVVVVASLIGHPPTLQILWLPVVMLIQSLLTIGFALAVAYIGVFVTDLASIIGALMRLWMLASPIFYFARDEHGREGIIPPALLDYYMLNPMAGVLDLYRDALIWGMAPDPQTLVYTAAFAIVACVGGFLLFVRGEGEFAKYI
jgi:lipopolysaccharide transport system permease protein